MRLVLIDCNSLCYAALYSTGFLQDSDGVETGVIFGFLKKILSIAYRLESNRFAFCWDSKKSYRKNRWPWYKASRKKTPEEQEAFQSAFRQFNDLRTEILPSLGFNNVFLQPGLEADDLIAIICQKEIEDIAVVSSDEDLYQLLRPNVVMWNPSKNEFITEAKVLKKYGVPASQWATVKAIAGCSSDDVPGVPGVGEKKACQYLLGTLPQGMILSRISESMKLIERNVKVVKLPYHLTERIQLCNNFPELAPWVDLCSKYGFDSLMEEEQLERYAEGMVKGKFSPPPSTRIGKGRKKGVR